MPRILLAEDDEIMRISISDRLKKYGWQVDEADGFGDHGGFWQAHRTEARQDQRHMDVDQRHLWAVRIGVEQPVIQGLAVVRHDQHERIVENSSLVEARPAPSLRPRRNSARRP